jgi:spermidine/putrescine transport system ATP-binding protein
MMDATTPTEHAQGALSVRHVTKRFGAIVAVDDVSLDLPAGCFFSLLGPSGCGKTTLLRMIAGLEDPDEGAILGDGQEMTRRPPERRPFNIVFQRYALFPHFTVFDNVAFGLTTERRQRPPREELRRRVNEMLRLVGLEGFETRMPGQLSGGQAQRVSVARALIRRPRVLLLDEPMAALDRNIRHQVREELLRIHSETGTTFLLVTHDQDEALSISQLVGLMNDGRLEQIADPETLYHQPATLFAARFVGAGCFVSGRVVGRDQKTAEVDVEGMRFAAAAAEASSGDVVQVLLRPEDLTLVEPGLGRVDGAVETCAFFGSYYELTVRAPMALLRLRSARPSAPGTNVGIDWPAVAGIAYPSPDESVVPVVSDDVDPGLVTEPSPRSPVS